MLSFKPNFHSPVSLSSRGFLVPRASLVAQRLKRLPAMRETRVGSLGREDPLEKEKAGLKLNIQNMKIMISGPITSWQIDEETM